MQKLYNANISGEVHFDVYIMNERAPGHNTNKIYTVVYREHMNF